MDETAAIRIAERDRARHEVPPTCTVRGTEQRFIEVSDGEPDAGARRPLVRDVRVWIVRFQAGIAWVELAVDQAGGQVVRVQRSRA